MEIGRSITSATSATCEPRDNKALGAYEHQESQGCGDSQRRLCSSREVCQGNGSVATSPAPTTPNNDYLENSQESSTIKTKKSNKDQELKASLGRFSQSTWKRQHRQGARPTIGMDNNSVHGLPGGGVCGSRGGMKLVIASTNFTDEVIEKLQATEAEIQSGKYDLVLEGLKEIQTWESCLRPSDAAIVLKRLMCEPTSQGLPYLAKEKMIEKLPELLFLVLRNPDFMVTDSLREELIQQISDFRVNCHVVGGPEIAYYKALCLLMIKQFPLPTEWKKLAKPPNDMRIAAKVLFNPSAIDMGFIKGLHALGKKVYQFCKKRKEGVLFNEYMRIQYLKYGVLLQAKGCIEEFTSVMKAKDTSLFIKQTCLMSLKQMMMAIEEGDLHNKLEGLLLVLLEDKDVQNMAIRAALEVSSKGYGKALKWLEDKKESLSSSHDVLKRKLIIDSEKVKEDLEQSSFNSDALSGITPMHYSSIICAFRAECQETEPVYVDLDISESDMPDAKSFPALLKAMDFLEDSSQKVLVLLGNAGSGKTHFCHQLSMYLLESYSGYIPLYGYLPGIKDKETEFANSCFESLNLMSVYGEICNRKLLFILDGYDEIDQKSNLIVSNKLFERFPECKVVVTCRAQEANSLENFMRHDAGIPMISERKILYIKPFAAEKIKEYIAKVHENAPKSPEGTAEVKDTSEGVWNKIQSSAKLTAVLNTPMMLRICLHEPELLSELEKEEALTKFSIYMKFTQSCHKKNIDKLMSNEIHTEMEDYTKACLEYAFEVLEHGKVEWNAEKPERQTQIKAGCPLKGTRFSTKGLGSELTFIHSTVLEYFVALQFRRILESLSGKQPGQLSSGDLAQFNKAFICNKINVISFIADYLNEEHKGVLLNIVKTKKPDLQVASANAITLLNSSGFAFAEMDLRGIHIMGADLSGGNFTRANLSGSDMKAVNLANACLDFADLSECDLRDAVFKERAPMKGHSEEVTSISFSGDGQFVASGSKDNTIRIWDVQTTRTIQVLQGHSSPITSISLSGDGKHLASASYDKTVKVWDVQSARALNTFQHSEALTSVSFSRCGKYVVSGGLDKIVKVWDLQSSQAMLTLEGHYSRISSVCFSADAKYVASSSQDKTVRIWDLQTSEVVHILQGHAEDITSVCFSEDGKYLVSGSYDKTVKIWDIEAEECIHNLQGHTSLVNSVKFSGDGKFVASGSSDNTLRIWSAETAQCVNILQGHSSWVSSVSFSGNGRYIASGSWDSTIMIWDLESTQTLRALQGHSEEVTSVSFSGDKRYAASGSSDSTIKVWDLQNFQTTHTLQGHSEEVAAVSFSDDGKHIASCSSDKTVKIWDLGTSQAVHTLSHSSPVNSVAFSVNGRHVASGSSDKMVRIWDLETAEAIQTLRGHNGMVSSVSFSADGKYVVSGSFDKSLKIWDLEASRCMRTMQGHTWEVSSVSFSADGKHVVSGSSDKTVRVWSVETSENTHILRGHSSPVSSVSFSKDGKYVVSGSRDSTVKVWDLGTSDAILTLQGHSSSVSSISFSKDTKYVVSGSQDKTLRIWDFQKIQKILDGIASQPELQAEHTAIKTESALKALDAETSHRLAHQFAFSSNGKAIVELKDNKIMKAKDLSTGKQLTEYREGASVTEFADLTAVEDLQTPLLPLHAEFSSRLSTYGTLFNHALISKQNLELLIYKRYNFN